MGEFSSVLAFPSEHQLQYVRSLFKPISSELGPRDFERDVVENAVQKLVDRRAVAVGARPAAGFDELAFILLKRILRPFRRVK